MPVVRKLALQAGALVLVCAIASLLVIWLIAVALGSLPRPSPAWIFWCAISLAAAQLVCIILIWRVFLAARQRFAQRLQAVTGGLDDRIFLASAQGTLLSILTNEGWTNEAAQDWLQSIHPDDLSHWQGGFTNDAHRIELRLKTADGDWRWHRVRAVAVQDERDGVSEWMGTVHDIHEQKLANEQRDLVIGELRHRLKNLVTVIDALAKNSRRRSPEEPGVDGFLQRFLGRLHALGTAGDLVLAGRNQGKVDAGPLIEATLAPFMSETARHRVRVGGPNFALSEELSASMGLAVHELATNALKYGALSVPEGSVSFTWSVTPGAAGEEIAFLWKETGGPPPSPTAKPGFGSRMIKYVVAREKSGQVEMTYEPDGLRCRITMIRDTGTREPAAAS